jgi:class 3 adenylate cyclase/tetratricopeptide (TPR) repeat protein
LSCAAPLITGLPSREVRKTVTVVFSDLKGSTSLGERLDTETLREILTVYYAEMQAVLERHGGRVEKFIGDAILAVFGLPTVHEDDALRAVRAAHEMQQALSKVNARLKATWGVRLENRTGVNTGEVVAGDVTVGQHLVTGDTVNTAARLEQVCPPLEVLIGDPTYRLVKDAVEVEEVAPLELKGKAERVAAYRLLAVRIGEAVTRRLHAPMVGREDELQVLTDALDRAVERRQPQLVTVLGPAGVGKSRLLQEFVTCSADRARSLQGRCLSYGDGITFWPLAEIVRQAAGIVDDDPLEEAQAKFTSLVGDGEPDVTERLASAIGLSGSAFPVQGTFLAARRLLGMLAADRPLIVLIDDLHWAEETFLELIRFLVEARTDTPVVVACASRPDLLEEHAEWVLEDEVTSRVILEPLSADESGLVVQNLLGTTGFDMAVQAKIVEAAEGNPLFVEQVLSMLIDDGILHHDDAGLWIVTSDLGAMTVPPSISALLAARLDRLGGTDRAVIECGAVIGQVFYRGAIEELVPDGIRAAVEPSLRSLSRRELVAFDETTRFAGQEAFRFLHIMIRDAAYQGLLKRSRAQLHEGFVDWLERVAPDRLLEYEEICGHHLEQAFLLREELGPVNEAIRRLGERGARYLSSAGQRALARGDMPAAESLLRRAAGLLASDDAQRGWLLLYGAEALEEMGEFQAASRLLATVIEAARGRHDDALAETAELVRLQLRYMTQGGQEEDVVRAVERAIEILERLGQHAGLARAYRLFTTVHWTACRMAAAEESTKRMIEHAKLAGDEVMARRYLGSIAGSQLVGPSPVPEAIKRCEDLVVQVQGDRKAEARISCCIAHLRAMQGEFEDARGIFASSRASLEELGWKFEAAMVSLDSGPTELLAGDAIAAEAELRADFDRLEEMGEHNYISTIAGYLAEALYRQDRFDEAEYFTAYCAEVASYDDVTSQAQWRSVKAKLLARRGAVTDAEALARQAAELLKPTDDLDLHATVLLDLAEVLSALGRPGEAIAATEQGLELFERKGNEVAAARARASLDELRERHMAPTSKGRAPKRLRRA